MLLSTLIVAVMPIGQVPLSESEPGLKSFLKSSLTTNESRMATGRGVFEVTWQFDKAKKPAELLASQSWLGDLSEIRVKLRDEEGAIMGISTTAEGPLSLDTPDMTILLAAKKNYFYNTKSKTVFVYPRTDIEDGKLLVNLLPRLAWYRCCPPSSGQGLHWYDFPEMRVPRNNQEVLSGRLFRMGKSIVFERDDRLTRLRIQFDGNVAFNPTLIEFKEKESGPKAENRTGKLEWKRDPSGVCYLARWEYQKSGGTSPQRDFTYTLSTRSFSPVTMPADYYTEAKFYARLPANTLVDDSTQESQSRRRFLINKDVKSQGDELEKKLRKELKDGGFLKKPE